MLYLALGYPLSVTGIDTIDDCIVEIDDNNTKHLTKDEAVAWSNLLCCGENANYQLVNGLLDKGLLIFGNNKEQLFEQCMSYHSFRQGIGVTKVKKIEHGIIKHYFSVRLGENNYILSDFQRLFWIYSSGCQTVSDIINKIDLTTSEVDIDNKEDQVFTLIRFGLLFLKK